MSLPDGPFAILSVAWPTQALTFIGDDQYGPFSGLKLGGSDNQGWRLANADNGQITLENQAVPNPSPYVWKEADGVPVTGNTVSYNWVVTEVTPGTFQIANADGTLLWALEKGDDYYVVVLRAPNNIKGKTAQFAFVET